MTFPEPEAALTHILVVSDCPSIDPVVPRRVGGSPVSGVWNFGRIRFQRQLAAFVSKAGEPTDDKPDIVMTSPEPRSVSHSFTIRVNDCQAVYEELAARGGRVQDPTPRLGARDPLLLRRPRRSPLGDQSADLMVSPAQCGSARATASTPEWPTWWHRH